MKGAGAWLLLRPTKKAGGALHLTDGEHRGAIRRRLGIDPIYSKDCHKCPGKALTEGHIITCTKTGLSTPQHDAVQKALVVAQKKSEGLGRGIVQNTSFPFFMRARTVTARRGRGGSNGVRGDAHVAKQMEMDIATPPWMFELPFDHEYGDGHKSLLIDITLTDATNITNRAKASKEALAAAKKAEATKRTKYGVPPKGMEGQGGDIHYDPTRYHFVSFGMEQQGAFGP